MDNELETIHAKLSALEAEVINLRQGYIVVNKRFTEALGSLKVLTIHASEAAKRAAASADRSVTA